MIYPANRCGRVNYEANRMKTVAQISTILMLAIVMRTSASAQAPKGRPHRPVHTTRKGGVDPRRPEADSTHRRRW
jgi:hypothetical protein